MWICAALVGSAFAWRRATGEREAAKHAGVSAARRWRAIDQFGLNLFGVVLAQREMHQGWRS